MMMLNSLDYVHVTIALSVTAWVVLNMMSDDVDSFFFLEREFQGDDTQAQPSHGTSSCGASALRIQFYCSPSIIGKRY